MEAGDRSTRLLHLLDLTLTSDGGVPTQTWQEQHDVEAELVRLYTQWDLQPVSLARDDTMYYLISGLKSLPGYMRALDARYGMEK
jgi:hypothetical protein